MKALLIAAILLGCAIVFWRPPRRMRRLGLGHLVSTGHAFLIVGAVLGIAFGDRILPVTESIGPIVAFVTGWIGFATGTRFDLRLLKNVPGPALRMALAPAAAAALAVGGLGALVLLLAATPWKEALACALVLGAAAASSGPTLAAVLRTRRAGRSARARATLRMIEFSAGVDDVVVIALVLIGFALLRSRPEPFPAGWFLLLAVGGGMLLGLVMWLFLGGRARDDERMLLGLAMLAFTAGFAGWLLLSPAAIAAVAGITLVNLPGERAAQLVQAVRRVERTAVVITMTVIGFHVAGLRDAWVVALVLAMTVVRFGVKHAVGEAISRPIPGAPGLATGPRWTYGLAAQGTLGLVVALSLFHVWRTDAALAVLSAVAVASILNELLSPWLLLALIRRLSGSSTQKTPEAA
jgi:hypothetical protein